MHILIVKLGAIGDIIHTLPALAAIRATFPSDEISWCVEARSAEILRGNPLINNLIEIDTRAIRQNAGMNNVISELGRQFGRIRQHPFDIAIDFQGLIKSAVVSKVSGARSRWGFARKDLREPSSRLLFTDTVKIPEMTHIVRKNLLLAERALSIPRSEDIRFPIFTSDEHRREVERIMDLAGENFAVINPAGGWVTKLWHAEKFGKLADRIWTDHGINSVIATAPNEAELAGAVIAASRTGKSFAVQPTLKGFYELAKRTRLYIGGDTGPTHLAVAAGAPVVGIFGPTEWWRNGSTDPDDICVERIDIECRTNCHRRTCSNWICMDIGVETAAAAVAERLRKAAMV